MKHGELVLISGNAHPALGLKLAEALNISLSDVRLETFPDSESYVELPHDIRGKDVFVLEPTCRPVNETLMELLLLGDALKRLHPQRLTAVIPYFGYSRQERRQNGQTSALAAKLVAELIEVAGYERILTLEIHSLAMEGFFKIPFEHLPSHHLFVEPLKKIDLLHPVVVAPDIGGVDRARHLAKILGCELAIIDKRRDKLSTKVNHLIGEVKGKTAIIFDDICDTAQSLVNAAQKLYDEGANQIIAAVTHGVFSASALHAIDESYIQKLFVTNSIPFPNALSEHPKIEIIDIAPYLAMAIKKSHKSQED
jgi:ribose-phosphate pyrophosphokinase